MLVPLLDGQMTTDQVTANPLEVFHTRADLVVDRPGPFNTPERNL